MDHCDEVNGVIPQLEGCDVRHDRVVAGGPSILHLLRREIDSKPSVASKRRPSIVE